MSIYDFYITPEEYKQAEANGISPLLLEVRIRSLAWSKERALNEPPHVKKRLDRDLVALARDNGICYSTYKHRVNVLGWDQTRAATQPLQDKRKQAKKAHESSRKYPKKYVELARENGIEYNTFRRRVKKGWDMEKAATRPTMTRREVGLLAKERSPWWTPKERSK